MPKYKGKVHKKFPPTCDTIHSTERPLQKFFKLVNKSASGWEDLLACLDDDESSDVMFRDQFRSHSNSSYVYSEMEYTSTPYCANEELGQSSFSESPRFSEEFAKRPLLTLPNPDNGEQSEHVDLPEQITLFTSSKSKTQVFDKSEQAEQTILLTNSEMKLERCADYVDFEQTKQIYSPEKINSVLRADYMKQIYPIIKDFKWSEYLNKRCTDRQRSEETTETDSSEQKNSLMQSNQLDNIKSYFLNISWSEFFMPNNADSGQTRHTESTKRTELITQSNKVNERYPYTQIFHSLQYSKERHSDNTGVEQTQTLDSSEESEESDYQKENDPCSQFLSKKYGVGETSGKTQTQQTDVFIHVKHREGRYEDTRDCKESKNTAINDNVMDNEKVSLSESLSFGEVIQSCSDLDDVQDELSQMLRGKEFTSSGLQVDVHEAICTITLAELQQKKNMINSQGTQLRLMKHVQEKMECENSELKDKIKVLNEEIKCLKSFTKPQISDRKGDVNNDLDRMQMEKRCLELQLDQAQSALSAETTARKTAEEKIRNLYKEVDEMRKEKLKCEERILEMESRQRDSLSYVDKPYTSEPLPMYEYSPESSFPGHNEMLQNENRCLEMSIEQMKSTIVAESQARRMAEDKIKGLYGEIDELRREKLKLDDQILEMQTRLRMVSGQLNIAIDLMPLDEIQKLPCMSICKKRNSLKSNQGDLLPKAGTSTKNEVYFEDTKRHQEGKSKSAKNGDEKIEKLQEENMLLERCLQETKSVLAGETMAHKLAEEKIKSLSAEIDELKREKLVKKEGPDDLEKLQEQKRALEISLEQTKCRLSVEVAARKEVEGKIKCVLGEVEELRQNRVKSDDLILELQTQLKRSGNELVQQPQTSVAETGFKSQHHGEVSLPQRHTDTILKSKQERINMLQTEICKLQQALSTRKDLADIKFEKKSLELEQKLDKDQQKIEHIKMELALRNKENAKLKEELDKLKQLQVPGRSKEPHQTSPSSSGEINCKPNKRPETYKQIIELRSEVMTERAMHNVTKNALNDVEDEMSNLRAKMKILRPPITGSSKLLTTTPLQRSSNPKLRTEKINELIAISQARAKQFLPYDLTNKTFNNNSHVNQKFITSLKLEGLAKNDISQIDDCSLRHSGPIYLATRKTRSEYFWQFS